MTIFLQEISMKAWYQRWLKLTTPTAMRRLSAFSHSLSKGDLLSLTLKLASGDFRIENWMVERLVSLLGYYLLLMCERSTFLRGVSIPKFNSEFAPEKWWLEDDPFLLALGLFSAANC